MSPRAARARACAGWPARRLPACLAARWPARPAGWRAGAGGGARAIYPPEHSLILSALPSTPPVLPACRYANRGFRGLGIAKAAGDGSGEQPSCAGQGAGSGLPKPAAAAAALAGARPLLPLPALCRCCHPAAALIQPPP